MLSWVGLLSRAAVEIVIQSAVTAPQRKTTLARSGLPTTQYRSSTKPGEEPPIQGQNQRGGGYRPCRTGLGTRLARFLALFVAAGGISAAVYALLVGAIRGGTAEGWVPLMVVVGLGLAAVAGLLALLSEMMTRVMREIRSAPPTNVRVQVAPPDVQRAMIEGEERRRHDSAS